MQRNVPELIDDLLNTAREKYKDVIIIGLTNDDKLDVTTTMPYYQSLHYYLGKTAFELYIHENSQKKQDKEKDAS